MTGLTITAAVLGVLIMAGCVALLFGSDRLATHLNERRRLLADPPTGKISPVPFRIVASFVFVVGLIIAQISIGTLIFG